MRARLPKQQSRRRAERLTALPSSPDVPRSWTAFVGLPKPGSEANAAALHLRPKLRAKGHAAVRPGKHNACAVTLKLRSVDKSLFAFWLHGLRAKQGMLPLFTRDQFNRPVMTHSF
jgi:hypothetical protein